MVWALLEKCFNTVALKIFTSVKSSTFSTLFFCGEKGRFTTQSAGPAALFVSLCSHFVFLVMGRSYMLLISSPSMSLVVALLMMFVSNVLSLIEVAPNSCATVYFATSDAEGNQLMPLLAKLQGWQVAMYLLHDLFAANTYQFFVQFPSFEGVKLCSICLCLRRKCSKGPIHRMGHIISNGRRWML